MVVKKLLITIFVLFSLFVVWILYGFWEMNDRQFTGNIYDCINTKVEYGHIAINDIEEVVEASNEITARLLKFSTTSEYKSFDSLSFENPTKTHCVYYAQTYKRIFDYMISQSDLKATCKIVREPIEGLGFVPKAFKMMGYTKGYNFTKDHDYVIVTCDNKEYKVDPTTYDLTHWLYYY